MLRAKAFGRARTSWFTHSGIPCLSRYPEVIKSKAISTLQSQCNVIVIGVSVTWGSQVNLLGIIALLQIPGVVVEVLSYEQ